MLSDETRKEQFGRKGVWLKVFRTKKYHIYDVRTGNRFDNIMFEPIYIAQLFPHVPKFLNH